MKIKKLIQNWISRILLILSILNLAFITNIDTEINILKHESEQKTIIHDIRTQYDWYVPQAITDGFPMNYYGDYSYTSGVDCGPASIAMVLRYLSKGMVDPKPGDVRSRVPVLMNKRQITSTSDLVNMLGSYNINSVNVYSPSSSLREIIISSIINDQLIVAPIQANKISIGLNLEQIAAEPGADPPSCPNNKSCTNIDGIMYAYNNQTGLNYDLGRYYDFGGGHWIVIKGLGTYNGEDYLIVYDPNSWIKNSKYWYEDAGGDLSMLKGFDRWYKFDEVIDGIQANGASIIQIPYKPGEVDIEENYDFGNLDNSVNTKDNAEFEAIQFDSDITLPGNMVLSSNSVGLKKWKVRNVGSTWMTMGYKLIQVSGTPLIILGDTYLPEIKKEGTAVISLLFVVPNSKGEYNSTWQAVDFNDKPINGLLSLSFSVVETSGYNDGASFINDISISDGTRISPRENGLKTWRLKNIGTTIWDSKYQLVFIRGDRLSAPASVEISSASPNQIVDISIPITAPSISGHYRGYWQLRNPQGTYFGPELWVDIIVGDTGSHITLLETDPPPPSSSNLVRIHAKVENLFDFRAMRIKVDGEVKGEIGAPEIWVDWSTQNYLDGAHSIVVEASNFSDMNWTNPEVQSLEYVLEGNSTRTNHKPNSPVLLSPGDWAVFEGTNGIVLSAQEKGDPDGDSISQYFFAIFDSHDTPDSGWINSNSWSPTGLGTYGYQWHVKVRDAYGAESGWSDSGHFTVTDPNPQIYNFSSQTCRSSWNQGDPDKICFCAQTNAGTLQLQVNMASDGSTNGEWKIIDEFGSSNYNCNLDTDSPPTLDPKWLESGTHRVRLYARREGGWEAAKTQDITISVGNLRPNIPGVKSLTNGMYTNQQIMTLNWDATQRTSNYRIELALDQNFSSTFIDQTVNSSQTSFAITLPDPYQNVYWRVTANGPYGSNSSTNLFHIDLTSPETYFSSSPSIVYDVNIPLNWGGFDNESGINRFQVQVIDRTRPDGDWTDWLNSTLQTAAVYTGQAGHSYTFRIRGMDQVGNWEEWPNTDGVRQLSLLIDPSQAPITPWWNSSYAFRRDITVFNNDGYDLPVHYPIHLQFNTSTSPTSQEIYEASLSNPKGNDIRITYNNLTELERFIQRFSPSQIDIWFPLQIGLASGSSDNQSYQLYYGNNESVVPITNMNSIFLPLADANTVGLWHFQEGSGSIANDSSGRNHNGTFYSSNWSEGLLGWSGNFNGGSSYVEIGHSEDFHPGAITLEAWIYINGSVGDFPSIMNKDRYWLRIDGNRHLQFLIKADGGDRSLTSNMTLNLNRWYHIAATFDGGNQMRLFVNGDQVGSSNNGAVPVLWNTQPLRIGRGDYNSGSYFPGYIQHVRISNIARADFSYARITNLPTVLVNGQQIPEVLGEADLVVLGMNQKMDSEGNLIIQTVIQNLGEKSTANGFYTDLYVDHLPLGATDLSGSVKFWLNDSLMPGAVATLTTKLDDLITTGLMSENSLEERNWTLFTQTDSTGSVIESEKENNVSASGMDVCFASPDEFDNNDDSLNGATLLNGFQIHNFSRANDVDWYRFTAKSKEMYTIYTKDLGDMADTYLYLYDQDGVSLLATNDDQPGSLASRIEWIAPNDGEYFIKANQWNPSLAGCGTRYTIEISNTIVGNDIYLPLIMR